ncbi:MAG: sulfotransferase [Actinomycetota bacterium]|nr:sulfotransferase [Actinomycetota bacterium]
MGRPGMNVPNFFIYGCERTGTTLLCALLSEHPSVYVLNDSHLFAEFNRVKTPQVVLAARKGLAWAVGTPRLVAREEKSHLPPADSPVLMDEVRSYYRGLVARWMRGDMWRLEYVRRIDPPADIAKSHGGSLTFHSMFESLYLVFVPPEHAAKDVLGEKTPRHSYLSAWIRDNYPEAKHITLIRSPVTTVASLYKRHARNLRRAVNLCLSYYLEALNVVGDEDEDLIVSYEDVIQNTQETLNRIFEYLGVAQATIGTTFSYNARRHYIGTAIDPQSNRNLESVLTARQKDSVVDKCRVICERFYPDLLVRT